MASQAREKLTIRVNSKTLTHLRSLAQSEGRELQALLDEALADLIEKRKQNKPRADVMAAYQGSHQKLEALYKKLAE